MLYKIRIKRNYTHSSFFLYHRRMINMKRKFEFFAVVMIASLDEIRVGVIKRYPSHNSTFMQYSMNSEYEHIPDTEYSWDTSEEYGPYYTEKEAWDSAYRIRDRIREEMNEEYDYDEYEEW